MADKKKDKKRLSGRFAIFITILLFVCTILFFNNRWSTGSLRRLSYWIFNGVRADATEVTINFDADNFNRFDLISDKLCVVSPDNVTLYKLSGKSVVSSPVLLRNPALSAEGVRFLAYDLGGLNFYVGNRKKILYSEQLETRIINANMNAAGHFSIVTDAEDAKNLVTFYNANFKPIYKFYSSEKYILDAALSPNAKTGAILTYGTENGAFQSTLSLCRTNSEGFYSEISLGNSVPLRVSFQSDKKILVVCDDRTLLFDSNGSTLSEISYNGLSLKAYSEAYKKHTAILLDNYENGGNTRVVFIESDGTESGSLDFDEDIYSISSAGNYTAIQFSDKCAVYKNDLTLHSEFPITADISRCIVKPDGSVLSIGENFATLYVK
ncbi:MAG: hypothetical protein IKM21_00925 [Oscillospiraceae bacterium]|nr:hypothetical protein [Oscillospiraceae bacterium]